MTIPESSAAAQVNSALAIIAGSAAFLAGLLILLVILIALAKAVRLAVEYWRFHL
jgi:hypothetical protein